MQPNPVSILVVKTSTSDPYEWLKKSFEIGKKNYAFALLVSFFLFSVNLVAVIPFLGAIVSAFISPFLMAGSMTIGKNLVHSEELKFENVFVGFQQYFRQLLPLALISCATQFAGVVISLLGQSSSLLGLLGIPVGILSLGIGALSGLIVPLVVFNNTPLEQAIQPSFKAIITNIFPLFLLTILAAIFAVLCIVFCFIPIVFIYMPAMLCIPYMVYSSVFNFENPQQIDTSP